MNIDYKVYDFDYDKKSGNLDIETKAELKSKKNFPYFYQDGKKIIFKPISKTKPLATPYFGYAEVVWSNILNYFFDKNIPIYHLARCRGYEVDVPKFHSYGTSIESITTDDERIVNIYEYFSLNPEEVVNSKIKDYINYCLTSYDYSFFFESEFFKQNKDIRDEIARQILYSLLRADQNCHYENISLIFNKDKLLRVGQALDHEFSTMFMYLDKLTEHLVLFGKHINLYGEIEDKSSETDIINFLLMQNRDYFKSNYIKNIEAIVKYSKEVVLEFLDNLNKMIEHLSSNPIMLEDNGYLEPFNSDAYLIGEELYKNDNLFKAIELTDKIRLDIVSVDEVNESLNQEILASSLQLKGTLEKKLTML